MSLWFFQSLANQIGDRSIRIIIVDGYLADQPPMSAEDFPRRRKILPFFEDGLPHAIARRCSVLHVCPKPNLFQGAHRLTREDWWAKSNALNTAICLCETPWITFVDDRSVLAPGWLDCVDEAIRGEYAVCGAYEKRAHLQVENGVVTGGELLGKDTRRVGTYSFDSWYGGSGALPLEWCLAVQGFAELCDGLGLEDSMFGTLLKNNGYPIMYDSRMLLIEDRTPGEIDGALKRADKGVSPNDKSHAIVSILRDKTTSQNPFDIRNMRDRVLSGEPFPPPTGSHLDWYDQQPIAEMT